jgi:hypothetical protein
MHLFSFIESICMENCKSTTTPLPMDERLSRDTVSPLPLLGARDSFLYHNVV